MEVSKIQRTIAKNLRDVNVHFNKTHIIVNYKYNLNAGKSRYKTVEKLRDDVQALTGVEVEKVNTTYGQERRTRIFTVEIKIQ